MSDDRSEEATMRGIVVWHCSEEDGGPDVGMTLGLGNGRALWVGEITKRSWLDSGDDVSRLGDDGGWWLALIPGFAPIAKFADAETARDFFDQVSGALATASSPKRETTDVR